MVAGVGELTSCIRIRVGKTGVPRHLRRAQLKLLRWGAAVRKRQRGPRDGDRLRVLAVVPTYLPVVRAGAERTIHEMLVELHRRGHEVEVLVDGGGYPSELDGVRIFGAPSRQLRSDRYRQANVVLTQLGARNRALRASTWFDLPLVQVLQMGGVDASVTAGAPDLLVYNAAWRRDADRWPGASVVLHPRIDPAAYSTTPGTAVTLIGLSERKGASTFYDLVARCPEREFLGVRGGWGDQIVPDPLPPNVSILENTDEMRAVYGRTRVLLMPSRHESFGRVAIEAGFSGIPTIARDGPGVREALGDSGWFVPDDDGNEWVRLIELLDEPALYERRSELARRHAESWDHDAEFDAFERALLELAR